MCAIRCKIDYIFPDCQSTNRNSPTTICYSHSGVSHGDKADRHQNASYTLVMTDLGETISLNANNLVTYLSIITVLDKKYEGKIFIMCRMFHSWHGEY